MSEVPNATPDERFPQPNQDPDCEVHRYHMGDGRCSCLPLGQTFGQPHAEVALNDLTWRCFHCDEVFTDRNAAMTHFGKSEHREAACTIDVARLRDLEDQLQSYRNEDTELYRQIARMQSDHATALRREEEKGYARGLEDAKKYPETIGLTRVVV